MKKSTLITVAALLFAMSVLLVVSVSIVTARDSKDRVTASDKIITKSLDIADFSTIKSTGIIDIKYTQSDVVSASVRCPDNLLEHLDIRVKNNTLLVSFKEKLTINMKGQSIELTLSSPQMNNIHIVGTGDVCIKGALTSEKDVIMITTGTGDIEAQNITCPKLTLLTSGTGDIDCGDINSTDVVLRVSGTGDVDCKSVKATNVHTNISGTGNIDLEYVTCDNIEAVVGGTGEIKLVGSAINGNYNIAGTGYISADRLEAKAVTAKVSGPATIKCHATQTLNATVSEHIGKILYRGNPEIITANKRIQPL